MDASSQTQAPPEQEGLHRAGHFPLGESAGLQVEPAHTTLGAQRTAPRRPRSSDLPPVRDVLSEPTNRPYRAAAIPWQVLGIADLWTISTRRYLVDGVVPGCGVTFLYGQSGLGKSFVALDLAFAVASGSKTWLDRPLARSGPVLYVVGEGLGDLPARAHDWLDSRDAPNELLRDFHFTDLPPNLTDESHVEPLIAQARQLRAALVVIDTLTTCTPGADQNNTNEMGLVVHHLQRLAARIDAPVLVVHHPGKDDSRGMRGSNALHAGVDAVIKLTKKRGQLLLVSEKQRAAAPFKDIKISLIPYGFSLLVHVVPGEPGTSGLKDSASEPATPRATSDSPSRPVSAKALDSDAMQRVIRVIPWEGSGDGYLKPSQVESATGLPDSTVRWALGRLRRQGRIKRVAQGVYVRSSE